MNSVLMQFLSSATLGALKVGLPSDQVVRQLGLAWDTSEPSGGAVIWKYGPLQVTVKDGRILRLLLSCLDQSPLPVALDEVTVPPPDTTLYAFLALLDEHDVPWQVDPKYTFDRQLCILTGGGVRAHFDLDRRDLQSLQV
jgi:hypothetical protein